MWRPSSLQGRSHLLKPCRCERWFHCSKPLDMDEIVHCIHAKAFRPSIWAIHLCSAFGWPLQIVPGTKVKKVYDTIQLSRASEVSFQLSQSSVEDNPSFDVAKAQECVPWSFSASRGACYADRMIVSLSILYGMGRPSAYPLAVLQGHQPSTDRRKWAGVRCSFHTICKTNGRSIDRRAHGITLFWLQYVLACPALYPRAPFSRQWEGRLQPVDAQINRLS